MLSINQVETMKLLEQNNVVISYINFNNYRPNITTAILETEINDNNNKDRRIREIAIKEYQKTLRNVRELSKTKIS